MHITLSPVRLDEPLAATRAGDVLTLNGEAFDFTQLPEVATLPAEAIDSDWIVGPVSRIDGELHLTLRLPHGPNPRQAVAFPEQVHVTEDGPVALPGNESSPTYDGPVSAGIIDWSQMITAEQKDADAAKTLLASRITANNTAYTEATKALTADYPQLEKDTWPTQNEQAAAWVADPAGAATPWIDRAAAERGIEREEYIRRTLIKARQFKVMSAFLTGRRQRYEDQIKAGNDPVLDYALTPEVLAELQQITETIMSTPAADLKDALA